MRTYPRQSRLPIALFALVGAAAFFGGCGRATIGSREPRSYGPIVRGGLKPASQVPANCQAFAQGRVSVAQCYNDSNCRPCIVLAVKDIPPAGAR